MGRCISFLWWYRCGNGASQCGDLSWPSSQELLMTMLHHTAVCLAHTRWELHRIAQQVNVPHPPFIITYHHLHFSMTLVWIKQEQTHDSKYPSLMIIFIIFIIFNCRWSLHTEVVSCTFIVDWHRIRQHLSWCTWMLTAKLGRNDLVSQAGLCVLHTHCLLAQDRTTLELMHLNAHCQTG